MKKIHSKLKVLEWLQYFSHYKSIGLFPNAQGQVTHKPFAQILLNFKPIQDMGLLVACKNEEDQSKINELEWSQHYSLIFKMLKGS